MMASMDMLPDDAVRYLIEHHISDREYAQLGEVLVRFIRYNLNDHGYVSIDGGDLVLDGSIPLTLGETETLKAILAKLGDDR